MFTNYGEFPADTAAREILEESGIKVVVDQLRDIVMDQYLEPDGIHAWPYGQCLTISSRR